MEATIDTLIETKQRIEESFEAFCAPLRVLTDTTVQAEESLQMLQFNGNMARALEDMEQAIANLIAEYHENGGTRDWDGYED